MSHIKNHEESLLKRLARSRAMNSRNVSRDASMSPTRCEGSSGNVPSGGGGRKYVHYIPCSFILPNYGGVSVSLSMLDNQSMQPHYNLTQPLLPQRKLSRLSNLVWTTSVSQPDLTRVVPTPTVSPTCSYPTSRAASPSPAQAMEVRADPNLWYYSNYQAPDSRSTSLSPCRQVSPFGKPTARIAPNKLSDREPSRIGHAEPAIIRNSNPAPNLKLANEFRSSSSPLATTATPWSSSGNIDGNLNQLYSLRRSVGTSCTDLANTSPFILETCQICSLFHPKVTCIEEESICDNPYSVYSPCLHGNQFVLKSGKKTSNTEVMSTHSNDVENAQTKSPDQKLGNEKIKRYYLELRANVQIVCDL